ncbi:efflux RND transporter periplasmic adaptor subunit [Shewanella surugensis]|uniref:Efflux RND transporter periplasmic adaptor subunit n=1 Tax=Shewanella surugensis TaxID=212020 RepID=A0ABT0LEM0_9GAMM|nr:efflux RND transporter periplasmic adaptor subunit [Shewanella surugensis]MCL1126143.1 efflux RND transporter periplasmic adaptor subunit [Shewanella surugensis]
MNNSRKRRILIVTVAIIIAAIGSYFIKADYKAKQLAEQPAPTAIIVEMTKTKSTNIGTVIHAVGTIQSFSGVMLRAQIAGRITAVNVRSGSHVKQGTIIIEINPQVLAAQLAEAQAELKLTEFEYQRQKKLYDRKVISLEQLTTAKSNYLINKAKIVSAQQSLDLASTKAEFDGQIGLINVEVGDGVDIGQELASLEVIDRLRVEFAIPQKYIKLVKKGDKIDISSSTEGNSPSHIGTVYAIDPLLDEGTRTASIRAEVSPKGLIPGSYAEISLMLDDKKPALLIPQTAVIHSLYGNYVYKVVGGKAKRTVISLGERQANTVIVTKGLQAGDTIVSAGLRKVSDGALISMGQPEKNTPPQPSKT